jgi:hypothetical protein
MISVDEWNFFLRGSTTDYKSKENPVPDVVDDAIWIGILGL